MKRTIDLIVAVCLFTLLLPIFLILVIILSIVNKGQPFFLQERPGKNEKVFRIVKFKSMTDARDNNGVLLPDEERIYALGSFIRKTSLDEIPQLLNVIMGDMSLVGPRPLRVHYLPYYTEREQKRHLVRPGVTGLAQVSGRNALSWDDRLEKDVEYVENLSFTTDLSIFIKTILKVLSRSEVEFQEGMQTFDNYRKGQIN